VGNKAIFCKGDCQGWIHRKYAGMTHSAFDKLGESDIQYLCLQCMLASQNREISELSNIIRGLNASIVSLTEIINSLQSSTKYVNQFSAMEQEPSDTTKVASTTRKASIQDNSQQDCKFNVVIYGTDECNKGTSRHE